MYRVSISSFDSINPNKRDIDNTFSSNTYKCDMYRYECKGETLKEIINKINIEIEIDYKKTMAELEAKVYAYEKIISNSNFKTILEEPKTKKKKVGENNE